MTITALTRRGLPKSEFGLPNERKYPVDTAARARSAKSYASKEEHKGHISKKQEAQIDRKANGKLGDGSSMGRASRHLAHEATSHPLARKGK